MVILGELSAVSSLFNFLNDIDEVVGSSMLLFKSIIVGLGKYAHTVGIFQCLLGSCLYKILFKKCLNKIKSVLVNYLEEEVKETPLEEDLRRLKALYKSLILNFYYFNNFMHPAILFLWLELMGILIINIYMTMKAYTHYMGDEIALDFRTYSNIVFVVYFVAVLEEVSKVKSYAVAVATFYGEITYLTSAFMTLYTEEKTSHTLMLFLNSILMVLYKYVHSMGIFQGLLSSCLYKTLFKKCLRKIESVLVNHLGIAQGRPNYDNQHVVLEDSSHDIGFEEKLKRLKCLYVSLVFNFNQLSSFSHPAFLLWWLELVGLFIIHFYMVMKAYGDSDIDQILLNLKTYYGVLFVVYYTAMADEVRKVNQDILSFLFKYPISKLSSTEAAQVEMLITTLTVRKPVLKASDIFTISTSLLASISGTVVTYVLVALQFHISWKM
ncbi:hypothetical protein ILUMI_05511 [Ignelater luminosus]|uniref:Gustatory receptor n=1 Tax=Ignelater luminosus TaxID=2038154 RepID=A0A8K0GDH8_IGNLU|nr:hypothetical protein ILUMI_05511 [Ignelater luminosus]